MFDEEKNGIHHNHSALELESKGSIARINSSTPDIVFPTLVLRLSSEPLFEEKKIE